jgi:glycosyltransferase involved in cell wall biosynthesis/uncharacterized protein (DUF362 family)
MTLPEKQTVAVIQEKAAYSDAPPYDPSDAFPEYPFAGRPLSRTDNPGYRAVRESFVTLGLDADHYGTPEWNPLRDVVPFGGTVVIKPNLVIDRHYGGGNLYSIITHPSMIRAVADYCRIALGQGGHIIVADASVEDCDFERLRQETGLNDIAGLFNQAGIRFDIRDLRRYQSPVGERSYAFKRKALAGDPEGDIIFDLGEKSALFGKAGPFFGSDPSTTETQENHHGSVQRYCVAGTALSCDTLISVPKLKVHKKVGVSLNLKGMVGINTNKNFLVHYTLGTPRTGGDEAPDLQTVGDSTVFRMRGWIRRLFFKNHHPILERLHETLFHSAPYLVVRSLLRKLGLRPSPQVAAMHGGNWYGNDTCWRMVADIAWVLRQGDGRGKLRPTPQRRLFSVVDGLIGGECNGPLDAKEKPAGLVVSGANLAAVDMVCTRLMGFDPRKLPLFRWFLTGGGRDLFPALDRIEVVSPLDTYRDCLAKPGAYLAFKPHKNWEGHIEMQPGVAGGTADGVAPGPENLRVCHLVTSLRTGGLERMVCDLIRGLKERGVPSVVFCTDEAGELFDGVLAEAKAAGRRKARALVIDWRLVRELHRFVRAHRVAVIHAHNPSPHLYGVIVSFLTGIPVVTTTHGQGYRERWRVRWLRRMLAARSKAVVFVSEDARRKARETRALSPARTVIIPNGIDTATFRPPAGGMREARVQLGIPDDAVLIGSVGRLSPEKNYVLLVQAVARAAQTENLRLVLVGDGADRARIQSEIDALNLKGKCRITGLQQDVLPWLQAMDIFCLSSDTEGLSISLLEAGACGLPCVVTDVGGNAEIVADGVSGVVVPCGDVNALAAALERLVHGDVRRRMGEAARRVVEERYSMDTMVREYERVYRRAAGQADVHAVPGAATKT